MNHIELLLFSIEFYRQNILFFIHFNNINNYYDEDNNDNEKGNQDEQRMEINIISVWKLLSQLCCSLCVLLSWHSLSNHIYFESRILKNKKRIIKNPELK